MTLAFAKWLWQPPTKFSTLRSTTSRKTVIYTCSYPIISDVWIGQTCSIGLWMNVNQYVETYINIHPTFTKEPWYQTWCDLISKDQILTKDQHFQFIAYRITNDTDVTVEICVWTLFELIPRLLIPMTKEISSTRILRIYQCHKLITQSKNLQRISTLSFRVIHPRLMIPTTS